MGTTVYRLRSLLYTACPLVIMSVRFQTQVKSFAGLSKYVDLQLVGRHEFASGAMALKYVPKG